MGATTLAVAASLLFGSLLSGCGGGDGADDRVKEFVSALQEDDFESACDMLSNDGLEFTSVTSGNPPAEGGCALESIGLDEEQLEGYADGVGDATETGDDQATVAGGSGDWALTQDDGEWKIDFLPPPPS